MSEYPVLFNDEMVRAIMDGRKTQTRRPVKPQPPDEFYRTKCGLYHPTVVDASGIEQPGNEVFGFADEDHGWKSPFGGPGDRLWVRECWGLKTGTQSDHSSRVFYRADGADKIEHWQNGNNVPETYGYGLSQHDKWRPNIHMPRWACRTFLPVVDVSVHRLQNITEVGVIAEGFEHREHFIRAWDSIYAKKNLGWDANPLVWVGTFQRGGDNHG